MEQCPIGAGSLGATPNVPRLKSKLRCQVTCVRKFFHHWFPGVTCFPVSHFGSDGMREAGPGGMRRAAVTGVRGDRGWQKE